MQDILVQLLDRAEALVAIFDPEDRLWRANRAYREAYHVAADETLIWSDIMRRNHRHDRGARIDSKDFETWLASALSRRGKQAQRTFEADLVDGRWLWIEETVLPGGWSLFLAHDVTALHASERDLRRGRDQALREALTDALTGVSNRRYMMRALEQMLDECHAGETSCLCLLDIDHFKSINDCYGHDVGDAVLVDFARQMRLRIRLSDSFGRIGGEEFMLILPGLTADDGRLVLEPILEAIRERAFCGVGHCFAYTVSAGLVACHCKDSASSLFSRADQALYDAKQSGRNRIRIAA